MSFVHNINPVITTIGPLALRWYSLAYIIGFLLVLFYGRHKLKERDIGLTQEEFTDMLVYAMLGAIIMARIFHVFVYNFSYYMANPVLIPAIWKGGLAFHGGLVGALLVAFLYCQYKKVSFYSIVDIAIIPIALALAVGRIANFINAEMVGRVTDVPWCVYFPGYEGCRHPVQIYESLKNVFIFFFLCWTENRNIPGRTFWTFITMYGVLRFIAEFIRDNGNVFLSTAQYLSLAMVVIGSTMFVYVYKQHTQYHY